MMKLSFMFSTGAEDGGGDRRPTNAGCRVDGIHPVPPGPLTIGLAICPFSPLVSGKQRLAFG
jgi:hypothetical protein